jgi:hypothetical protein
MLHGRVTLTTTHVFALGRNATIRIVFPPPQESIDLELSIDKAGAFQYQGTSYVVHLVAFQDSFTGDDQVKVVLGSM